MMSGLCASTNAASTSKTLRCSRWVIPSLRPLTAAIARIAVSARSEMSIPV